MRYLIKNSYRLISLMGSIDAMSNVLPASDITVLHAVNLLRNGYLVALPTDTVYGIAANATCHSSIQQLYHIKGRDFKKPIAICVGDVKDVKLWGETESLPKFLLENLLPGPVTVLLKRSKTISLNLNPGVDKVGIRVPDNEFICKVASSLGSAIALTSANISSEPSTVNVSEFKHLWHKLGAVFDSGFLGNSRAGSTIVDLTIPGKFSIVRSGSALQDTIEKLKQFGLECDQI